MARHEADRRLGAEAGAVGEVRIRSAPVAAVDLDEDVVDVGPNSHVLALSRGIGSGEIPRNQRSRILKTGENQEPPHRTGAVKALFAAADDLAVIGAPAVAAARRARPGGVAATPAVVDTARFDPFGNVFDPSQVTGREFAKLRGGRGGAERVGTEAPCSLQYLFDVPLGVVSTTRTTTYRFRAVVPAQSDYPWVEGASRPAKVLVRG